MVGANAKCTDHNVVVGANAKCTDHNVVVGANTKCTDHKVVVGANIVELSWFSRVLNEALSFETMQFIPVNI